MFEQVEIDCLALVDIGDQFRKAGEFNSGFFRPIDSTRFYPQFVRSKKTVIADVLDSGILHEIFPFIVLNDRESAFDFTVLNRYEFEGSILNVLLEGTCTERVVRNEAHAREVVQTIFAHLFPTGQNVCAFRLDGWSWWNLEEGSPTLAWAYLAYASVSKHWWFVSFADFY